MEDTEVARLYLRFSRKRCEEGGSIQPFPYYIPLEHIEGDLGEEVYGGWRIYPLLSFFEGRRKGGSLASSSMGGWLILLR
jgi:hypothetical protein